ncbi:MAG: integral rane protein [Amycolatopsis sp.]|nr:integral rane protein [Amycolatopsis sp.]
MAQARGSGDRKKIIAIVIGVVVLAAVVIGGVVWTNASKNATEGTAIGTAGITAPAAGVVETRNGVVVTTGKPSAKASIDIYADFLCPFCGQLQSNYGAQINQAINAGQLKVNWHMVDLLNNNSDPAGYSLDSANAALAAADAGKFTVFHDALFAHQPEEGKRGYDKGQLIQLGKDLGITDPKFAAAINGSTYNQQIDDAFNQAAKNPALQTTSSQGTGFATPTVVANGKILNTTDATWLQQVIAGGAA